MALGNVADAWISPRGLLVKNPQSPVDRWLKAEKQPEESRLTGSVRADNCDELSFAKGETGALPDGFLPVASRQILGDDEVRLHRY